MSGCDGRTFPRVQAHPLAAPLIWGVRAYQVALSPVFGDCCRFSPSCSNYMIEALRTHGVLKGLALGTWRILRCHPFGKKGYDPVPPVGRWTNQV